VGPISRLVVDHEKNGCQSSCGTTEFLQYLARRRYGPGVFVGSKLQSRGGEGGGKIDVSGPGVGVMSSWVGARRYQQLSGTSMATPFVAGVGALLAEAYPSATAVALQRMICDSVRCLSWADPRDVGTGLIQAPV
jgi:subtilisin family serine protease